MQASELQFDDPIDRAVIGQFGASAARGAVFPGAVTTELVSAEMIDDGLRAEWRDLAQAARDPNPYFAAWFLEPALRNLTDPSGEVKLCLLRRGR